MKTKEYLSILLRHGNADIVNQFNPVFHLNAKSDDMRGIDLVDAFILNNVTKINASTKTDAAKLVEFFMSEIMEVKAGGKRCTIVFDTIEFKTVSGDIVEYENNGDPIEMIGTMRFDVGLSCISHTKRGGWNDINLPMFIDPSCMLHFERKALSDLPEAIVELSISNMTLVIW